MLETYGQKIKLKQLFDFQKLCLSLKSKLEDEITINGETKLLLLS